MQDLQSMAKPAADMTDEELRQELESCYRLDAML